MAKRKTQKEFELEMYNLVGNEYTFLGEYKNSNTPVEVRHNKCGETYKISPSNFKRGKGCKKCNYHLIYSHKVKDNSVFIKEVYDKVGDSYVFLQDYINTNTPIKVKHKSCGNVYNVAPRDFLKGSRCAKCFYESTKMSQKEWNNTVNKLVNGEYIFLEDYKGNGVNISVKHKTCGNIYKVKPNNFITGHRCPKCNTSIGENLVSKYLDNNKINYNVQHTFKDLKGKKGYLKYDFYLPEYGVLIEYNGIQHYKPIEFFGGVEVFKNTLKRDSIKKEYALKHNYKFIEIPFYVSTGKLIEEKLNYEMENIIV